MAIDVKKIINDLLEFYNFDHKIIVSVGAGGGQLIEYARNSLQVIAIDTDDEAINKLENVLCKLQLLDKFTLIKSDFFEINRKGDVVLFEFCLHEMQDAEAAIKHAFTMAPDILILDHWPGSEWADVVDEKDKVVNSWNALNEFKFEKLQRYDTVQFFHDYEELYLKVKVQGENSINRIKKYRGKIDFTIPMSYGLGLIGSGNAFEY